MSNRLGERSTATAAATPVSVERRRAVNRGSNRAIILSSAFLALMFLFAAFGSFLAPHDPAFSVTATFGHPTRHFLFGGDDIGRDVFSRVLAGGRNLAWMAPLATAVGVAIGATIGILAAFYRGTADVVLMRAVDVFLAFPAILLVLLAVSMIGPKLWLITILTGVSLAPGVARVIRGAALAIAKREYVQWAISAGFPSWKIMARDFLPNLVSPLTVEFGIRLMWAIGGLASISFLGYGVQPPTSDWGLMVSENKSGLTTQPLGVIAPMVAILLFALACNLVVESIGRRVARTQ